MFLKTNSNISARHYEASCLHIVMDVIPY